MTTDEAKRLKPGQLVYDKQADCTLVWEVVKVMVAPQGKGYRGFNVSLVGGERGKYYIGTYNAFRFSTTYPNERGVPDGKHPVGVVATAE